MAVNRWCVATLLAASVSLDAVARESAPPAVLVQAQKSYAAGDYLSAIRLLERGLASGQGLNEAGMREQGHLYLAAAYFAKGDTDAAQRTLVTLFTESPGATVSTELFPPRFIGLAEQARALSQPKALPADAPRVAPTLSPTPSVAAVTPPARPSTAKPRAAWWPIGLGAASISGGGVALVDALIIHQRLLAPSTEPSAIVSTAEGRRLAEQGAVWQVAGWALVSAGAVAVLAGVLWWWLAPGGP